MQFFFLFAYFSFVVVLKKILVSQVVGAIEFAKESVILDEEETDSKAVGAYQSAAVVGGQILVGLFVDEVEPDE